MILMLAIALLPLGLIALIAAIESAHSNHVARQAEARIVAGESAARLGAAIGRTAIAMRATATALALNQGEASGCRQTLDTLATVQGVGVRLALLDTHGRLVCSTAGYRPTALVAPAPAREYTVTIDPAGSGVVVSVPGATGTTSAVGLLPLAILSRMATPRHSAGPVDIGISDGGRALTLLHRDPAGGYTGAVTSAPIAGGQLMLNLAVPSPPIRPVELAAMLLPIVMLVAAAVIGWLVLDQLILKPLARLQQAVDGYRPGAGGLTIPPLATPAREITQLSEAFSDLTTTVARHEAELEQGLARQTRLTREVHHRVKNNLQVVASLINLHARGVESPEVARAYASIQRRVDALAIVHRNHYAEYETNRGVALRPLVQELAGNLRSSATDAKPPTIVIGIEPLHVSQDNAVAIAFLVTELVELAMLNAPGASIAIRLARGDPGRAQLTVESPALRQSETLARWLGQRFGRVIEGLARQLRTRVVRDEAGGSYRVEVPVLD